MLIYLIDLVKVKKKFIFYGNANINNIKIHHKIHGYFLADNKGYLI